LGVSGVRLAGIHGVYPEEREHGNRFRVGVEVECASFDAVASDELADTIDYQTITSLVREISDRRPFNLIESFAGAIADEILTKFPSAAAAIVRVSKVDPPGLGDVECAWVEVARSRA